MTLVMACSSESPDTIPQHIAELENVSIHQTDPESAPVWNLKPEVSFGDTDDVLIAGHIRNFAVDDQGRVYIADTGTQGIHIYAPDGSFLSTIGREGRGPGEFQTIMAIRVRNNRIHVLDRQQKIVVFEWQGDEIRLVQEYDLTLQDLDEQPGWMKRAQEKGWYPRPASFNLDPDGRYLIHFVDSSVPMNAVLEGRTSNIARYDPARRTYTDLDIISFDWTGRVLVHEVEGGMSVFFDIPYKRDSRFDYRDGEWVHGWSEEFLLRIYDNEGNYLRASYYNLPQKPLDAQTMIRLYENAGDWFQSIIREDDHPETWPAFQDVFWDDEGRIWVSRIDADPEVTVWMVLDADGELIGRAELPTSSRVRYIGREAVYAIELDEEELIHVMRYRLER